MFCELINVTTCVTDIMNQSLTHTDHAQVAPVAQVPWSMVRGVG